MYQSKKQAAFFAGPIFILSVICLVLPANADTFTFSTGNPDGRMASAARPDSAGKFEIESADDFVLTASQTSINSATFTGLLTGGATIANVGEVKVEIYRVFPADSNVARTSGPPTFSTVNVPTRVNSPSDVALAEAPYRLEPSALLHRFCHQLLRRATQFNRVAFTRCRVKPRRSGRSTSL